MTSVSLGGLERLRRIKLPEIARVVGDEDKIAVAGVAHDIPVLRAHAADMGHVPGFMAGIPGDGDQVGRSNGTLRIYT